MSEHLHTVKIHPATEDELVRIEFTCRGDQNASCHQYPDCDCEFWDDDHPHPKVPHTECWMRDWFENDCILPHSEVLDMWNYKPGMEGPIKTTFRNDFILWEFVIEWKFATSGGAA